MHAWSATDRAPDKYSRRSDTLEGVTEIRRLLKQGHHRFRATAPGLVGESEVIHVAGSASLPDFEIVMRRARRVIARIVDQDGVPLRQRDIEVTLTVLGPDGSTKAGDADTDETGAADVTEFAPSARSADVADLSLVFTLDAELPASETAFWVRVRDHWTRDRVRVPAGAAEAVVVVAPTVPSPCTCGAPARRLGPFSRRSAGRRVVIPTRLAAR